MATNNNTPMSGLDKLNLAFGVVAILLLTGALATGYMNGAMRPAENVIRGLQYGGYGFMALYVLTLAWLKRDDLKGFAGQKHTQSGANSGVQIVAVLALLTAVNWYGTRHHVRVDLTENKQYSLADQTKKIIGELKDPVDVTLFVKTGDAYSENLKNLWKEYEYAGPEKIKLQIVDIDRDPLRARNEKVTAVGTSVLQRGERKTTITAAQEQDLTSALLKVTQNGQKVVYFTAGHGEFALDKFDQAGISYAKDALEKQNYKVDTLSLFGKATVPTDAALVIVAGPDKPFLETEAKALQAYLDKGGRVFLALRPQIDVKLGNLTHAYGIDVNNDIVLDPRAYVGDIASPVVQKFPYHTITQGLQAAYFTGSRSLKRVEPLPKDVHITPLVESGPDAWGETNFMDRQVGYEPGKDTKGPVELMMLAEKGEGRLIVSGNATFLANAAYVQINNGDLFMNALNWMADEKSLVAIPPKDNQPKTVDLLPWQYNGVFIGTVFVLPLLLLLTAGFVWWRRR